MDQPAPRRRAGRRALPCAVALALLLLTPRADAVEPGVGWHTLETSHFVIHFHDGLGDFAQRAARALEGAHALLSPTMQHAPREKTQVQITDDTDDANGSATAYLRPTLRLLAAAPDDRSELNDFDDFLWLLVVHEYTHILHLDQTYGFSEAVNRVFGRLYLPNGIQPDWFVEGYAVHEESKWSPGGRVRSSLYDMYLRAEVLEGRFLGLDDASNSPVRWPRGSTPYLHGSRFMDWLAKRFGEDKLNAMARNYGARLVPFAVNLTAEEELGKTFVTLYDEWRRDYARTVAEKVTFARQRPLTELTRVTFRGERTDMPRFGPDARLYYLEQSADRRAALRSAKADGTDDRLVKELRVGGNAFALTPDGEAAILSQPNTVRQFNSFNDLFRLDLATGAVKQLTSGARLAEPDVAPDGTTLVALQRQAGGKVVLVQLPIDGGPVELLYASPRGAPVYDPRCSPDGRLVAFTEQRAGGGRDVMTLDLATREVRQRTDDASLALDPVFDPSGRLLYATDLAGIYNVYALDLETGARRQLTNVLTGAFRPTVSPDGKTLGLLGYSTVGYDVAVTRYLPDEAPPAPRVETVRPKPVPWDTREVYPVRAYDPLETLAPQYWLPVLTSDALGPLLGVTTSGGDLVGRHAYSAQAGFGLESLQPSVDVSYSSHVVYPRLGAGFSTGIAGVSGAPEPGVERQTAGSAFASFPFSATDRSASVSLSYEARRYAPLFTVPAPTSPTGPKPFVPESGLSTALATGFGYSSTQSFANAISAEEGFALNASVRLGRPELGSDFTFSSVDASFARFQRLPWAEHHVLAVRLAGGLGVGDLGGRRLFSLGGIGQRDPLLDALNLGGSRGASLRGYHRGAFRGRAFALLNAEYRFPVVVINQGLWTFPFYVRRLHGAATFDAGQASDQLAFADFKPSVGAELRTELMLGYGYTTDLRLGYARGLAAEGIDELFVTLGSGF